MATREHPGANLVINCEDQSNYETSICISQRQPIQNLRDDANPTPYAPSYEGQTEGPAPVGQQAPLIEDSGERPNIPERVEHTHYDSHPENVAPIEGEPERSEYNAEQPNYNSEESYGSRSSAIADQEHQQEQPNVNENVHTQEEPRSQGEGA